MGRPMTAGGRRLELLVELQAKTMESIENERDRCRLLRELAVLESAAVPA